MNFQQAIKLLEENEIQFETSNGFDGFHFHMITFKTKKIATKAVKLIDPINQKYMNIGDKFWVQFYA